MVSLSLIFLPLSPTDKIVAVSYSAGGLIIGRVLLDEVLDLNSLFVVRQAAWPAGR